MKSFDEIQKAWESEYKRKGIPSSFRSDPTKTVVEFISWLDSHHFQGKVAADIGCGRGRNSFYLASHGYHVTGIDLVRENIEFINSMAREEGLSVKAFVQDVSTPWPFDKDSLDVVIDVFCYKHITTKSGQALYREELRKSLKKSGYYFISLASENDGFYGPLLSASPNRGEKQIIDPHGEILSFLYSIEDLEKEFSDHFKVVKIGETLSTSPMYGKEYTRRVINAIFQRI